jgi:UDP-N-acetylglucosamine 2-epimerase
MRILTVIGTRPEAIKMAPVALKLSSEPGVTHKLCITAQHRQMLDQVLDHFSLTADFDLNLMRSGQDLTYITEAVTGGVGKVIRDFKPDCVLVQGDTTTTFAAALAAFYHRTPVAHVEAGLRTGNIYSPWPEEMNRKLTTQLSTLHFAPTSQARANLLSDGVNLASIEVTGNTVIDALMLTMNLFKSDQNRLRATAERYRLSPERGRIILVTGHRRENFDGGLERVFAALAEVARRNDVQIVFPVHLNPIVQDAAKRKLGHTNNVTLMEPVPYEDFVWLMSQSYLIVTDSGGVQEEAPSLGKPVLVTRDNTERPEAVEAGTVELVGTDSARLINRVNALLDDKALYTRMSEAINPYGDGKATERIVRRLVNGAVQ